MFPLGSERSQICWAKNWSKVKRAAATYGQLHCTYVQDLLVPTFVELLRAHRANESIINTASYATGGSFSPADNRGFTTAMAALPVWHRLLDFESPRHLAKIFDTPVARLRQYTNKMYTPRKEENAILTITWYIVILVTLGPQRAKKNLKTRVHISQLFFSKECRSPTVVDGIQQLIHNHGKV